MQLCFSFHALRPHQLSVSPVVQDDVLGFQVSVDDPSGVQERKSLDDAAGVEAGGAVVKRAPERQRQEGRSRIRSAGGPPMASERLNLWSAPVSQEGPQLSPQAGFHQHVEVLGVSEGTIESGGQGEI